MGENVLWSREENIAKVLQTMLQAVADWDFIFLSPVSLGEMLFIF